MKPNEDIYILNWRTDYTITYISRYHGNNSLQNNAHLKLESGELPKSWVMLTHLDLYQPFTLHPTPIHPPYPKNTCGHRGGKINEY